MSRLTVGSVTLLTAPGSAREVGVGDFAGKERSAWETPAVVAGPDGLLLEVAHRRWDRGGQVIVLSRGDSAPAYDRLLHGARLGIQTRENGTDFCEADVLRWNPATSWGNPGMAKPDELDQLAGQSVHPLLVRAGALDFGPRARVLGDDSKRRNRLCVTFPAEDPVTPLFVYTITRVLPITTTGDRT